MKNFYKIITMFITVIMCVAVVALLVATYMLDIRFLVKAINFITGSLLVQCTTIAVSILTIVVGICVIFSNKEDKKPIALEGANGELAITQETIENISNNVVRGFEGTKEVESKIFVDKKGEICVYVSLMVVPGIKICELTGKIQVQVKEEIKKMTDIDIVNVNVKIKNIYEKNQRK